MMIQPEQPTEEVVWVINLNSSLNKKEKSKILTYIICHYKRGGDKPKDLDPIQWEELKSQDHDTWKALSGQL